MKYLKNNFAGGLTILALLGLIFKAFLAKNLLLDENLIEKSLTPLVISYLAFKISYMETKKVGLIFLPLLIHSLIMAMVVNGGISSEIFSDLFKIIRSLYGLIIMVAVFFILELLLNRLLGSLATSLIGGLSIIFYLTLILTNRFDLVHGFEEYFLYFSFYVMALRLRSASRVNPVLIVLVLILLGIEIYLRGKYIKIDFGFLLTSFPLAYLALKTEIKESYMGFKDYIALALIYAYPTIFVIIKAKSSFDSLAISIIAILSSYILGEGIYKLKNKYLAYLLLGIG